MKIRPILRLGKKTKCSFCGSEGFELLGNFEQWFNLTHVQFIDCVKEHKIVDSEYGCWNCIREDTE